MRQVDWKSIYSPTPPDEIAKLDEWCRAEAETLPKDKWTSALEIGSYDGATAALLASYFDTVFCIDPWGQHEAAEGERIAKFSTGMGQNEHFQNFMKNMERLEIADRVIPVIGTSARLNHLVLMPYPSVVFIDGAHTYNEVQGDLFRVMNASDSGLVIVHDYRRDGFDGPNDPYIGVRLAVDDAIEKGLYREEQRYSGIIALRRA